MYQAAFVEPDPGYTPDVRIVQYSGPAQASYSAPNAVTYIRNSYIRGGITYSRNPTFYIRQFQGEGLSGAPSYVMGTPAVYLPYGSLSP